MQEKKISQRLAKCSESTKNFVGKWTQPDRPYGEHSWAMINHHGFSWVPCDAGHLSKLEAVLRYRLPPLYRQWILEFNGGFPTPSAFTIRGNPFSEDDMVTAMLGLFDDEQFGIASHMHSQMWMLRQNFFPVALAASSSYLGLEMKSKSESIVMIDVCDRGDSDGIRPHYFISKDIESFLENLW